MTVDVRRRVLVVAAGAMREALVGQLSSEGFEVESTDDALHVVETVRRFKPDVVVVEEVLPHRAGRQVVLSLRANGDTFKTPVAGVLSDVSVPNTLQWLRVGATDIWKFPFTRDVPTRTRELIDECDRSQVQLGQMRARVLAWVARAKLTGTVTMYAGTPFEGWATFLDGAMTTAQFGSFSGEKALEQLLELEDGPMHWDDATTQPEVRAALPNGYRPRVLVVEDDPTLRKLVMRQLESANYQVEAVEDGAKALQLAPQKPWDVMVVDLDLPRLDGWGLMRALRTDVAHREIAVLVLSAHEGSVETLKAARAGARAYLRKSGKSKELLDTVSLLATPRARLWNALAGRASAKVELRAVGGAWLLRALAELDCQGRLELEDAMGRYELTVTQGHLVDAVAQTGSLRVTGTQALQAVLSSRGEGRFVYTRVELLDDRRWLYELLDETCDLMRREEASQLAAALAHPGKLFLNEELAGLFARVATVDQLMVLDAVKDAADDLAGLARTTGLPPGEVEQALATLLRRGVLTTAG